MTYNGMELAEVKEPQVFDEPKEMLAWNSLYPSKRMIVAILPGGTAVDIDRNWLSHCAYVPKKTAPRMVTNRELSKWLAQGNGQISNGMMFKSSSWDYHSEDDSFVKDRIRVRKWDGADWHEPTADYLGLEDK